MELRGERYKPDWINGEVDVVTDLKLAQLISKKEDKPIFIIFTGYTCLSNSSIDVDLFLESNLYKIIDRNFVWTMLYVDDKTPLLTADTNIVNYKGRKIKNVGSFNMDYQITRYQTNAQPWYCIIDSGLQDCIEPMGISFQEKIYRKFIFEGLYNYFSGKRYKLEDFSYMQNK
jgi:hypothetical protein